MIKQIEGNNLTQLYKDILKNILINGKEYSPRGKKTKELHPFIMTLHNPVNNIIYSPIRAINPFFMISEFIWIITGKEDVDFVSKFNKNMRAFSDNGDILNGAYGPRIRNAGNRYYISQHDDRSISYGIKGVDQLAKVILKLKEDNDTRQAVIAIFDAYKDYQKTKDVPCNIFLKFTLRDNRLDLTAYVRSQDMILGFPYDAYHWTLLQQIISKILNVKIGKYFHIMDSAHLYQQDYKMANEIVEEKIECNDMLEFDEPMTSIEDLDLKMNHMHASIKEESHSVFMWQGEYMKNIEYMFKNHYRGIVTKGLINMFSELARLYNNKKLSKLK